MSSQLYTFVKTQTVQLKWGHSIVCKLYLNKVDLKRKKRVIHLELTEGRHWVLIWGGKALYSPEHLLGFEGRSYTV